MADNLPDGFEDPADFDDIHELAEMPYIDENLKKESFVDWYMRTNPEEFYKHFLK